MNKFLLLIVFLSGIAFSASAQTKPTPQLSIGGEFGFPVGPISIVYGTVLGASVKLEIPIFTSRTFFTITGGFTDYLVKLDYTYPATLGVKTYIPPLTYMPFEIGAKYYFSKLGYVEGDLGVSTNINTGIIETKEAFIFAPVIGFSAPVYKHKTKIDIGFRYEGRVESGGTVGQIAARAAYRFGL